MRTNVFVDTDLEDQATEALQHRQSSAVGQRILHDECVMCSIAESVSKTKSIGTFFRILRP